MDRPKTLIKISVLLFICIFPGCNDIRDVELCQIDWKRQVGDCAQNDEKYEVPLPQLDGYYSMSEADLRKILQKLQSCDQRDDEEGKNEITILRGIQ